MNIFNENKEIIPLFVNYLKQIYRFNLLIEEKTDILLINIHYFVLELII